jgi:hypothetical protein
MAKKPDLTKEEQDALIKYLKALPKPKPAPMRPYVREYFETVALPLLKTQALSELQRTDEIAPRLISFMDDNSIGIVDVSTVTGGTFGDWRSKEATARVHRFSTMVPSVRLSIFVSEVWMLNREGKQITPEVLEEATKGGSIADHPDRAEGVMFNVLHYDRRTGELMQLMYTIEVLKVLGAKRTREAWRGTQWGTNVMVIDPMAGGEPKVLGRFSIADPENDFSPPKAK